MNSSLRVSVLTLFGSLVFAQDGLRVWGSVPTPSPGTPPNAIYGIAPVSASDVWAVGQQNATAIPAATPRRTLIEHWNGNAWSVVPSTQLDIPGFAGVVLRDVVALQPNDVWAVGYAEDFSSFESRTLIAHWNGLSWSLVPSPNPAGNTLPDKLYDLAVLRSDLIYAVGGTGDPERGLIVQWNGTQWSSVPNPCSGPLLGVSAASATEIFAVSPSSACRFNGVSWTNLPIPSPPFPNAFSLKDVAAISANDVWVVGSLLRLQCSGGGGCIYVPQGISLHWNGVRWSVVPVPFSSELLAVLALASNDIWAVGHGGDGFIIHWNGVRWRQTIAPAPTESAHFRDVKTSGTELWAGGSYWTPQGYELTLTARTPTPDKGHVFGDTQFGGATVTWVGPASGSTTTDPGGNYVADDLPAGRYVFIAAGGGCAPAIAIIDVSANTITRRNLPITCN